MSFKINSLYLTDGYKIGHKQMLANRTTKLYGTWIPRSTKYAPPGVDRIVSFGQQLVVTWLHDEFQENFFSQSVSVAEDFQRDMSQYLGLPFDGDHFVKLHTLGYLPIKIKSLPEGIETGPNIPHMTFINTVDGYAWLTLYLETIISSLAWKPSTSATIALRYRRNAKQWIMKTDRENIGLLPFICHDFSARGLSPWDMITSGLGHATSFRGSDTLPVIPAARHFYGEPIDEVCINSVNASEHSVSTTKIFTVGEQQMISDWIEIFPTGILSIVSDTFDLWKLITEYLPANKEAIMARDGKLVIRPDSGDPVDIICGTMLPSDPDFLARKNSSEEIGVIELLWNEFGGTTNEQGYKVLDSHIGCIYGDSITVERQLEIYKRLKAKGFAATNIVLGVGSYTYQMNTRDTFGWAAKGAWFQVLNTCDEPCGELCFTEGRCKDAHYEDFNIYKDPITDDGTKKSLKGKVSVRIDVDDYGGYVYVVNEECDADEERNGILKIIYEDGRFSNLTTLSEIREKIDKLC